MAVVTVTVREPSRCSSRLKGEMQRCSCLLQDPYPCQQEHPTHCRRKDTAERNSKDAHVSSKLDLSEFERI
jgi:hypothetical protein